MQQKLFTITALATVVFAAFSSSPSYQLQNYGLSSGGTSNSTSSSYKLNATSGEVSGSQTTGAADAVKSGEIETQQANTPLAPTLSNGSNVYYNKLQLIINKGGSDASDYTYSVAVSTDNFTTTNYVQADGTIGATAVYQTYALWGGASGTFIIGLNPSTTYKAKVNAVQGNFTASPYGAIATATTANPSLSFSLTPNTLNLGNLYPNTIISGASNISMTFDTNAASGGAVYVAGKNSGLSSAASASLIAAVNADLTSQTEGFGLVGLTTGQTSGGPLSIVSPFNGSGSTVGAPGTAFKQLFSTTTALVGGSGTASVKAKASSETSVATDYTETLTFIASASF